MRLSNPNAADTTINYTLTGTATNGVHYTNLATSVLIPAGETNAILTLSPINNNARDGNRTGTPRRGC